MNLNKGHALIAVLSICLSFSVGTNIKTSEEHKKIRSKYEDVKGSYMIFIHVIMIFPKRMIKYKKIWVVLVENIMIYGINIRH